MEMFHVTWAAHELIVRHGIDWRRKQYERPCDSGRDEFYARHLLPRGNYLVSTLEFAEKFCRDGWGSRNIYRIDATGLELISDPYFDRFPDKALAWRDPATGKLGSFYTAEPISPDRITPIQIFRVYVDPARQAAVQQIARAWLTSAAT
jgi:hypothetical protein